MDVLYKAAIQIENYKATRSAGIADGLGHGEDGRVYSGSLILHLLLLSILFEIVQTVLVLLDRIELVTDFGDIVELGPCPQNVGHVLLPDHELVLALLDARGGD